MSLAILLCLSLSRIYAILTCCISSYKFCIAIESCRFCVATKNNMFHVVMFQTTSFTLLYFNLWVLHCYILSYKFYVATFQGKVSHCYVLNYDFLCFLTFVSLLHVELGVILLSLFVFQISCATIISIFSKIGPFFLSYFVFLIDFAFFVELFMRSVCVCFLMCHNCYNNKKFRFCMNLEL